MCRDLFGHYLNQSVSIIIRSIVVLGLTLLFFYGLVIYPLTDLYAALLCICAGYLLYLARNSSQWKQIGLVFAGGLLSYCAYNVRTIYQLAIIFFVILIFVFYFRKIRTLKLIAFVGIFVLGILIAAIPQFILNWNLYGIISPWINNQNLFVKQLMWGLEYSRYATFVGPESIHDARMYFLDPEGIKLVDEWGGQSLPMSIKGYCALILQYPLEYLAILVRHLCNAIFVLFPEQYIADLSVNRLYLALLSLLIAWLFLVLLIRDSKNGKYRNNKDKIALLIVFILPSVFILFGAVEERFLVLPYMLVYGYLAFYDYGNLKRTVSKKQIALSIIGFIVFAVIMIAIEEGILNSLNDYPLSLFM